MSATAKHPEKPASPQLKPKKRTSGEAISVFVVLVLFVVASGVLFSNVDRNIDPNIDKNWWTLAFESRETENSDFTVENHSSTTRFTYTVTRDNAVLKTGVISIAKGALRTVYPALPASPGRTTVSVVGDDGSKKDIYRER